MNTDFQAQLPPPKLRSHLTIEVKSKLMSRPCPHVHGSKPPVAPKPLYRTHLQGVLCSSERPRNGFLAHSAEEQEHLNEMTEGRSDSQNDEVDGGAVEEGIKDRSENGKLRSADEVGCDDSEERVSVDDGPVDAEDNSANNLGEHEDAGSSLIEEEVKEDFVTDGLLSENDAEDKSGETVQNDPEPGHNGLDHESNCVDYDLIIPENQLETFAFGFSVLPTLTEEYPYDVIGPNDNASDTCESCDPTETGDLEVWQPERATKDVSGCFRFSSSTEDVFGPYSVIESLPSNRNATADPELCQEDAEETQEDDEQPTCAANPEPFYVSSDDVEKLEDQQETEGEREQPPNQDTVKEIESADEYADIDDSLCYKEGDDFGQLECVSSEDYVEIGDEEEDEEWEEKKHIKGISAKDRTAKREQALLNHRKSCQPRLRLCNITVPTDLDLGRTPELTNRVVFAHTTEAFEEDIEELDCHIVPYYEETDSDNEEHIYEEAGFDSEGENFLNLERKTIVTRSRSYSGKVPGYVPETVPEETGTEYQTHDYCTVALNESSEPLSHSQQPGVNCLIPSMKSRRFLLYSRSAEGPELSMTSPADSDKSIKNEIRMRRKDDNLSLPCVITSSGSFSHRSRQSSSGVSTPTSLVDIPPPFDLAYITKRPVTKSSPSVLIHHEPVEKIKNKSSFKRFLALKFRRKTDSKGYSDGSVRSSRSSSESSHHGPTRVIELDRKSNGCSPQLQSRTMNSQQRSPDMPFILHKEEKKSDSKVLNARISRVESFEERSRRSAQLIHLTKPRSISFPCADTSDYENIPAMSSDYENIQIPGRPVRSHTVTEFFEDPNRMVAPCNENDGYVDMNSFPGIEKADKSENESAYTEPFPLAAVSARLSAEEDHGRTSEEEEAAPEQSYDRQIDGRSRAYYIAKEICDTERLHVSALKHLQEDFREAVGESEGGEGEPVMEEQKLEEILGVLPQVLTLHSSILAELEERIGQWEESQRVVDVILSRREDFGVFETFISEYDRSMSLLEESCRSHAEFASVVKKFERKKSEDAGIPLKHQLLQVIVRVLQYRMLLTDYLNNLSPDSKEYEDTQAALVIVSEVADLANDNLKQGENLLRMVHIEYSVKGRRDLLKPGRMFVKEGTLMKVSRKCRQPRHLFLMNDIMLYTYPQQDGKYRLKNTLSLSGMKVSKPVVDNILNCLTIEVSDITIVLSAGSMAEREDWFHTLSRAIADHAAGLCTFGGPCSEAREKLWMALGEAAPVLVPVSQVMMCMNCTSDFSLTLRRHHCNACGKVVCRACSRNRYPLKYLKDRVAKVCDHCFSELRKRGGSMSGVSLANSSPRSHRASRPLSAVFQSLQPPSLWKSRKSVSMNQVSLGLDGSTLSGSLHRRKKSKRKWKRLWFLLKDKVLYTFTAREDKVAAESLPLQGFTVRLSERLEGEEGSNQFHLYHKKTLYYTFRAEDHQTARRWVNAIEEATVL